MYAGNGSVEGGGGRNSRRKGNLVLYRHNKVVVGNQTALRRADLEGKSLDREGTNPTPADGSPARGSRGAGDSHRGVWDGRSGS